MSKTHRLIRGFPWSRRTERKSSHGRSRKWLAEQLEARYLLTGLDVTFGNGSVQEGTQLIGTVTRTSGTTTALVVTLASSDPSEATVPPTVTIPVGSPSATFTLTAIDDGYNDSTKTVTITASEITHSSDAADIQVKDLLAHRMSNLTVVVQDQHGTPLPNATIDVSMTRHGFRFGTQVRDRLYAITQSQFNALNDTQRMGLLESGSGSTLIPTWTDVLNYRQAVSEHFNHIVPTNGLQWVAYQSAGPANVDAAIVQAQSLGIGATGHAVVWGNDEWPTPVNFRPAANPNPQTFHNALIAERFSSASPLARYSDAGAGPTITDWDVLNEPINERYYSTTFTNAGIYTSENHARADMFIRARALRPDASLAINEYNIINAPNDTNATNYRNLVNNLLALGAPIDVIKVQAHISRSDITKADITRRLNILAETGLPIVISEFDMRDDTGQLTPTQQGQTFRNFLEASFEHPSVDGFVMWGFWDPGHWRGNGPLYNTNWTFKAEAAPWTDLVEGEWMPTLTAQAANANGRWVNDAALFDGTYNVKATFAGQSTEITGFSLTNDGQITITVPQINQAPTDISLAHSSVAENLPSGTNVGTFSTSDPNVGNTFTYALVPIPGNSDHTSFAIVGNTLRTASVLDFEAKSSYSIRVRSTDQEGLFFEKNLMISIADVNEPVSLSRVNAVVIGNVQSTLTNTGSWTDPEGNNTNVALTASLGTVLKNVDGTWSWSHAPTTSLSDVLVTINATDGSNVSTTTFTVTAHSITASRNVFYNSASGANLSSAGAANNAIDTSKLALRTPGTTSTFANSTNYSRGLNGVIVDIAGLPVGVTDAQVFASLLFSRWNGIDAGGFAGLPAPAVPTVSVLTGSGVGGSARVKITFPDNSLQDTWLRVTVLANATTGLGADDVFYFGHVMGDTGTGNTATRLRVNATDTGAVRSNQSTASNSAGVTNIYDINRDGRVNATDTGLVRSNQQTSGIVAPFTVPMSVGPAAPVSTNSAGNIAETVLFLPLISASTSISSPYSISSQIIASFAGATIESRGYSASPSFISQDTRVSNPVVVAANETKAKPNAMDEHAVQLKDEFFASLVTHKTSTDVVRRRL